MCLVYLMGLMLARWNLGSEEATFYVMHLFKS